MRITHLTKYLPEFAGGIEQATKMMADAGTRSGHEVEILGIAPEPRDAVIRSPTEAKEISLGPYFHVHTLPIVPGYFRQRGRILRSQVLHLHMPNPLAELALLLILRDTPRDRLPAIIPVLHAPIMHWRGLGNLWERKIQQRVLDASDRVVVSSRNLMECFKARGLRVPDEKLCVLPFSVPTPPELSPSASAGKDKFHFLAIARLVRYKGLDVLIEAAAKMSGNWHLTLVGAGPLADPLRARVRELGLADRVSLHERVSEDTKHRLLEYCDALVLPSVTYAEAFGLAIAEAFSHGKPVVTTDISTGVAFLARNGECGAVARAGSADSLAESMTALMRDPARCETAGRSNREFWRRELSPERYFHRYDALLAELRVTHRIAI